MLVRISWHHSRVEKFVYSSSGTERKVSRYSSMSAKQSRARVAFSVSSVGVGGGSVERLWWCWVGFRGLRGANDRFTLRKSLVRCRGAYELNLRLVCSRVFHGGLTYWCPASRVTLWYPSLEAAR